MKKKKKVIRQVAVLQIFVTPLQIFSILKLTMQIEENNKMGKTRDLFKKIGDTKGIFHAKMGSTKDRSSKNLMKQMRLRKGGKNSQKNYTKKIFRTQITMMLLSPAQSQTFWNVKSSGPQEASLRTKLLEVMEFQLSYFKS